MSDSKKTNPKDAAATTKLDLSLFPDSAIAYGALAFTEGDLKYGGYNWRADGVMSSVYVAAAKRHLAKWFNGENVDPKTHIPHLASAIACLAVLIDAVETGNLNDDRPPSQDQKIFAECEEIVTYLQTILPRQAQRHRAHQSTTG